MGSHLQHSCQSLLPLQQIRHIFINTPEDLSAHVVSFPGMQKWSIKFLLKRITPFFPCFLYFCCSVCHTASVIKTISTIHVNNKAVWCAPEPNLKLFHRQTLQKTEAVFAMADVCITATSPMHWCNAGDLCPTKSQRERFSVPGMGG